MTADHKVLAIIPARGGSKGLPRKNILPLGGKPLIGWTIDAAHGAKCVGRTILSSDDLEIAAVARSLGCEVPFMRPASLATDSASTVDVVLHALGEVAGYDYVLVLQPTSPLRTAQDIDDAFAMMIRGAMDSCVSICQSEETPYWMYGLGPDRQLTQLLAPPAQAHRRQDLPKTYILNGAIYLARCTYLQAQRRLVTPETIGFEMPRSRSLDIDTIQDLNLARLLLKDKE